MLTAEVALPVPLPKTFTYLVPDVFRNQVKPGLRVEVSFGKRQLTGVVVKVVSVEQPEMFLKPIASCVDLQPLLGERELQRAQAIADHYLCSLGEILAAMLPKGVGEKTVKRRKTRQSTAHLWPGLLLAESSLAPRVLLEPQRVALESINAAVEASRHETFLLYGVPGSGKTEVYLQAAAQAVSKGMVVVLVPEILLTPQIVLRFQARFGDHVGVWHSRLSLGERQETWEGVQNGRIQVMIGTRSAMLLPLPRVSLIVMDEEHEGAYRQEERPRYHAREVALIRGKADGAPVVLGSATPSLESWYAAHQGVYRLLHLPHRPDGKAQAEVTVINMRHWPSGHGRLKKHLSPPLEQAIETRLAHQEQVVLFLNRRGFATIVQCLDCGKTFRCKRCDVTLVWHKVRQKLVCHYCGWDRPLPEQCDQCQGYHVESLGAGTERVEEEVRARFPAARVARLDTDAVTQSKMYFQVLESFAKREIDILIGTQMIAKGLHLPHVTLVGVVNADTALHLPDFRAAERTYQLLTQVAGRAGRGERPGRVMVQTYVHDHYSIQAAATQPEQFYEAELGFRKMVQYPPYAHLVRIGIQARDAGKVQAEAKRVAEACLAHPHGVDVLGPAPAPLGRIKSESRYQIILRHELLDHLREAVGEASVYDGLIRDGVRYVVDVDPLMVL